jgi:hypothetical protein
VPDATDAPVDLRVVVAEIYDEVQRRRRTGQYPPGLERELDAVFARHAPAAALGDDLASVLDRAERAAFIDVDVPTASNRPGVPIVKQGLRKAMAWYLRYVAQQVSTLGGTLVRVERMLADRLAHLEDAVDGANALVADEVLGLRPAPLPVGVVTATVATLGHPAGRVLVAECGAGELVGGLAATGLDVYGTEPRRDLAADAARQGLEVRDDGALDHLRRVEDGSLAAVVLVGVVDGAPLGVQLALADRAVAAVRPDDGVVLVVCPSVTALERHDPVRTDLMAGRPLHAATWIHVLTARGLLAATAAEFDGWSLVRAGWK